MVTIQNNSNFGNRLQNYALQTVIEGLGHTVDNLTLSDIPLAKMELSNSQKIKNAIRKGLVCLGIRKFRANVSLWERKSRCMQFSQKYIHHYLTLSRSQTDHYDFGKYDFAVTGSDQVWHNWKRIPNELSYYYLEFISEDRTVSYAPSFGFKDFPSEDIEQHKKGLNGIRSLSCREQEGCDLIRSLTGREARLVVDPTLLLTREQWESVEKKPDLKLPEKFLLQFLLGKESEEYRQEINRIARLRELTVVNIGNTDDRKLFGLGPDEFVWMIHHADTVCTDSFHASVFSLLFERNLRVFDRIAPKFGNMFGRLHDLMHPLDLDRLVYGSGEEKNLSTGLDENAKRYMENRRQESLAFLRASLEV